MVTILIALALALVVAALAGWSGWVARGVERIVPAEGRFVDVPGARLHYVELGSADAPAIVMVHGLMGQLRNFSHSLGPRLAVDHRLILVDRPGWGHSTLTGPRPGIAAQAAMIAALIERLELDRPLLVGHSFGGAVSLALGLAHPGLVRGLALIAPLTQPVETVPKAFRGLVAPAFLRPVLAWVAAVPVGMRTGPKAAAEIFAPDALPDDFATLGGGALALRPKSFLAGSFEVPVARAEVPGLAARYGELRVPVAILFGREDHALDPALHGETTAAAIPGATLALIDGGHMPLICRAEETEAWLRAASAAMP